MGKGDVRMRIERRNIWWCILIIIAMLIGVFAGTLINFPPNGEFFISRDIVRSFSKTAPWLSSSVNYRAGDFIVAVPPRSNELRALVVPHGKPYFPIILIDYVTNGSITVIDNGDHQISLQDTNIDGTFNSCTVASGSGSNRVVKIDQNFDGTFDVGLGVAGYKKAIMLNGQWTEFSVRNREIFAQTTNGLKKVVFNEDGLFRLTGSITSEVISEISSW